MEEVAKTMYSSNVIPQEKTLLEAEQRARYIQRCMYENGYDDAKKEYEKSISEISKENELLRAQIEELKKQLEQQ